jgi:hypothetical protein
MKKIVLTLALLILSPSILATQWSNKGNIFPITFPLNIISMRVSLGGELGQIQIGVVISPGCKIQSFSTQPLDGVTLGNLNIDTVTSFASGWHSVTVKLQTRKGDKIKGKVGTYHYLFSATNTCNQTATAPPFAITLVK